MRSAGRAEAGRAGLVTLCALGAAVAMAAAGVGVAAHRRSVALAVGVETGSGLREVPVNRTLEPGAAITTASPETTTTTPPDTAAVTSTTRPARPAPRDLSPLVPDSIDAKVSAFGDSVMLEAEPTLATAVTHLSLDAVIGRQAEGTLEAVRAAHDAGDIGDEAVVQVGNNGPVTSQELDEIMSLLSEASRVVLVNVKVDRDWEEANNDLLASRVDRWPNAVLLDWHDLASTDPEGLLSDGVHLQPAGVQLYSRLIVSAL